MIERGRTFSEIAATVRATPRDVDNWLSRTELSTTFEKPVKGAPRRYSRANVEELALISAFSAVGAKPSVAAAYARSFIGETGRRHMEKGRRWLVFAAGDLSTARSTHDPDLKRWSLELDTPTLACVDVGGILEEVARLFGGEV